MAVITICSNFGGPPPQKKCLTLFPQIGKKEFKLSLFTDDVILCIEDPEDVTTDLLELIN